MVSVRISCHAELQALHKDRCMLLHLVSLESLSVASDSYVLLRNLIDERRSWQCPHMDLLSIAAGVALELHKMKHHLFPLLLAQEANNNLEGGFPRALQLLKNSAITIVHLVEDAEEIVKERVGSFVERDVLFGKTDTGADVKSAAQIIELAADDVLYGHRQFDWFQVQFWLGNVDKLLWAPVHFPDPILRRLSAVLASS